MPVAAHGSSSGNSELYRNDTTDPQFVELIVGQSALCRISMVDTSAQKSLQQVANRFQTRHRQLNQARFPINPGSEVRSI